MGVAIDAADFRDFADATVTGIVFGGFEIEITPGKVVQERGREDVVVIDADHVAVVRNARVVGIDNGGKGALSIRQSATIMIGAKEVIFFADVFVDAKIPLVRVGIEGAGESVGRDVVILGQTGKVWHGHILEPLLGERTG